MILTSVTVKNFGPFRGTHVLELGPVRGREPTRPIIVIGGRNGSGKTSLLDAIRLCLHGRRALGNPRTTDYHDHLRNRIHREPNGAPLPSALLSLSIETVEAGQTHCYQVVRSWRNAADVREDLRITRDGAELPEHLTVQLQGFLDELVPLGLSEFFFFDGEHIQKLADESGSDQVAAESIRGLLGLQIPSRLMTDLNIFVRSSGDANTFGDLSDEMNTAETDLANILHCIEELNDQISMLQDRKARQQREIDLQEQKITAEGGNLAQKRSSLIRDASKWRAVSQSRADELRELASGLLPFCLVPELTEAVGKRIEIEASWRREAFAAAILNSKREELLELLASGDFWTNTAGLALGQGQRDAVARALSNAVLSDDICGDRPTSSYVHDLAEREQRVLLAAIEHVLGELPSQAVSIGRALLEADQNLGRASHDLARIPSEEALEPLMTQLVRLHKKLDSILMEIKDLEEELRRCGARERETQRNLRMLTSQAEERREKGRAVHLATKVQNVLKRYGEELTIARADHLAQCVTECCQWLAHKQSLVNRVELDPETLTFALYDARGNVVYRPLLSAGEKQILAIAFLWGLGRASARDIPIVIDTPLARLDADHRNRLLTKYFPNASHQVILLSTDSEISDKELELLNPSLDRTLHLRFDPERECTTVEEGYLPTWEGNDAR